MSRSRSNAQIPKVEKCKKCGGSGTKVRPPHTRRWRHLRKCRTCRGSGRMPRVSQVNIEK